ncbi:hypothetical protein NKJ40_26570 [Mesorhizobium sp. M0119]|uniref:hypothetical protein n=1 Tax=unclassified Mesorhizobium TaxID=325217 RepID=UPI00333980EA
MPAGRQDDRLDLPKSKYPQPDLNQIDLTHRSPRDKVLAGLCIAGRCAAPVQYAALNEPIAGDVPQTQSPHRPVFEIFSLF